MNRYIFLLVSLILTGCVLPMQSGRDYIVIKNELVSGYVKNVSKKHQLNLAATGGRLSVDIKVISLGFRKICYFDVNQSRDLVVPMVEEFLAIINSNREVRPYLHDYPCSSENFELMLSFMTPQDDFVDSPYIANVLVISGFIYYSVYVPKTNSFRDVFKEPYQDAYNLIYGQTERDE